MNREEWIRHYFEQGYTHKEIVQFLYTNHEISISIRHLQRILRDLGLKRKDTPENSLHEICAAVLEEIDGSGSCLGYKSLWRRLQQFEGYSIRRETVRQILRIADPEGIHARSQHRLKRRRYIVPGPHFLWHVDGYDKLKPFGFAIHGCIDGFSRKILWLEVATSNNKPEIIAHYYLHTVKRLKTLPALIRSDNGTENSLIETLQQALRYFHDDQLAGIESFIKGKSTSNQRIESYWSQMRRQGADFWISLFKDMRDTNIFNDSNEVDVLCLRYCFGPLIKYELDVIRKQWNLHRIRKQKSRKLVAGKPNCLFYLPHMYGARDFKKPVDQCDIQTCIDNYTMKPELLHPLFDELVQIVMPNIAVPTDADEALSLYINLTDNIANYVNDNT